MTDRRHDRRFSAIIAGEDVPAACRLGRLLATLDVMVAGIADSLAAGLALLAVKPEIVFLLVRSGREYSGFEIGRNAIARGMGVVYLGEAAASPAFDCLLAAVPAARRLSNPSCPEALAAVIAAYRLER
jgi:hypothetical protein